MTWLIEARRLLTADDFYLPNNQFLFQGVLALTDARVPFDSTAIVEYELEKRGLLEKIGGPGYLDDLLATPKFSINFPYYVRILKECGTARRAITLCSNAAESLYHKADVPAVISDLQSRIYGLTTSSGADDRCSIGEGVAKSVDRAEQAFHGERPPGLHIGYKPFDDALLGIRKGSLVILAGDTGCGKSTFALNIAENVAAAGGSVLYVSAEMDSEELSDRFLSARSGVPAYKLRTPNALVTDEWTQLQLAAGVMSPWKVKLIGRAMNAAEIILTARQLAAQWERPLDLIVCDYLQLMPAITGDNRAQQIGGIALALKQGAMDLGTPILALSQLNRATIGTENGSDETPPSIHGLKESGDIENHANVILMLYRPKKQPEKDDGPPGTKVTWARIGKSRSGSTTPWEKAGAIWLHWQPSTTRFVSASVRMA